MSLSGSPESGDLLSPASTFRVLNCISRRIWDKRNLTLTTGLVTALTLTAGGLFWHQLRSWKTKTDPGPSTSVSNLEEEPENRTKPKKEESEENKEAKSEIQAENNSEFNTSNLSWIDMVEEEEQILHNMEKRGLDDESLNSKLQKLNLKEESKNTNSTAQYDSSRSRQITARSDSGLASPNVNDGTIATPPLNSEEVWIPLSSQNQSCPEENEDYNFDVGSSENSVHVSEEARDLNEGDAAPSTTLSDSGQGSEADDATVLIYHFLIPNFLCGKLIGVQGATVSKIKEQSKCKLTLSGNKQKKQDKMDPNGIQTCIIEGTRSGIDKCLELIREKFPIDQFPELSMQQVNSPIETTYFGQGAIDPMFSLNQGFMQEVTVSTIITAGQVSIQLPNHPTYSSFSRLNDCMGKIYFGTCTPGLPRPIHRHLVCVAPGNEGLWYRVQVLRYDDTNDSCTVKCLDYGNVMTYSATDLRQIRSDFLTLPFQGIDCLLANVIPLNGMECWPQDAFYVLSDILSNMVCSGQMVNYNEDFNMPIIDLYIRPWDEKTGQPVPEEEAVSVSRELVERGVADWVEGFAENY